MRALLSSKSGLSERRNMRWLGLESSSNRELGGSQGLLGSLVKPGDCLMVLRGFDT